MAGREFSDYVELVAAFSELPYEVRLFGGIAEDALLNGALTRPHGDVDVFVLRPDLPRYLRDFAEWGFVEFETRFEVRKDHPLALGCPRGPIDLELGVFDRDQDDIYFEVVDEQGSPKRVYLPDDTLSGPVVKLDGASVRVLSPLALAHIRRGLELIGTFGPLRDKDIAVQAQLLDRFFDGQLPSESRIESSIH